MIHHAQSELYNIILGVHNTEKTARCQEKGQYVFKVRTDANKTRIKRAVEKIYGCKVVNCQTVNRPPKFRARRRGYTKAFRLAYVTLEDKQQIRLPE